MIAQNNRKRGMIYVQTEQFADEEEPDLFEHLPGVPQDIIDDAVGSLLWRSSLRHWVKPGETRLVALFRRYSGMLIGPKCLDVSLEELASIGLRTVLESTQCEPELLGSLVDRRKFAVISLGICHVASERRIDRTFQCDIPELLHLPIDHTIETIVKRDGRRTPDGWLTEMRTIFANNLTAGPPEPE